VTKKFNDPYIATTLGFMVYIDLNLSLTFVVTSYIISIGEEILHIKFIKSFQIEFIIKNSLLFFFCLIELKEIVIIYNWQLFETYK